MKNVTPQAKAEDGRIRRSSCKVQMNHLLQKQQHVIAMKIVHVAVRRCNFGCKPTNEAHDDVGAKVRMMIQIPEEEAIENLMKDFNSMIH